MSRIQARFAQLRKAKRKALIPYITAGAPEPDWTVPVMHALVQSGADVIELGMPFSDPMADGPVIQQACERSLGRGVRLVDVLAMVRKFREQDSETPLVLMGYLNPIETLGAEAFAQATQAAGADGVLLVDLPPEEGAEYAACMKAHGLDMIRLVAPTTTAERMARICQSASGFVYYVALKGVTGAANLDTQALASRVDTLRRHTHLPVGVGFGVSDAGSAAAAAQSADAVIVGSALVERLLASETEKDACMRAGEFMQPLRNALP